MSAILDRLHELAQQRERLARLKGDLAALKAAFDAQTQDVRVAIADTENQIGASELTVRTLATDAYRTDGTRAPAPGVTIKLLKQYAIDETAGLAWARQAGLCLIPEKLDVAAVKKVAAATPLAFVTITEEPSAQIATDLAKALAADAVESAS